jgi:hypothetical protein
MGHSSLPSPATGWLRHHDRDRQEAPGVLAKVAEVELPILGVDEPGAGLAAAGLSASVVVLPRTKLPVRRWHELEVATFGG